MKNPNKEVILFLIGLNARYVVFRFDGNSKFLIYFGFIESAKFAVQERTNTVQAWFFSVLPKNAVLPKHDVALITFIVFEILRTSNSLLDDKLSNLQITIWFYMRRSERWWGKLYNKPWNKVSPWWLIGCQVIVCWVTTYVLNRYLWMQHTYWSLAIV